MADIIVPFVTGLTAGGLSCLLVQGGLLSTSIARRASREAQHAVGARKLVAATSRRHAALPIAVFLGAKIVAYTLLGALLGALGSAFELSPFTQGILQLGIGIFVIGNVLRMLDIHPIFRWFVFEPPKVLTRYIRRAARDSADELATPAFLGALSVFIPCGITLAMLALAIGSGNPLSGAAIMFAFTLCASPLFFALAYLATHLGEQLEARFLQFAALATLVLGLISLNGALNALGSPLSFSELPALSPLTSSAPAPSASVPLASGANPVFIQATDNGYVPNVLRAKAGEPLKLVLVTDHFYG